MINIKATWILNLKNEFPDQIKLMVKCPGCEKEYNNINYILRLLPKCLPYIKTKSNGQRPVRLIDHCPFCGSEFTITSLYFKEDYN